MKIIKRYQNLEKSTRSSLAEIVDYQFGHVPIVKEYEWAAPDWAVILYLNGLPW
jgi:hypothetical protein